jgi:hypothetical protein
MQATVDKCMAFCQALAMSNHKFAFSLTIGKDTLNFNNKELDTSSCKKKKSPSQVRREAKRREEREKKKAAKATENVADLAISEFKCDECSYTNVSEKGLKQHTRMKHRKLLKTPEKERHTSNQGDLSLNLSPGGGLREEQCVNCGVIVALDHQCDTVIEEDIGLNKFKDQETQTKPTQEDIQEVDVDNEIGIQLCVPMYVRDKTHGLGTCLAKDTKYPWVPTYDFKDCLSECPLKLLYPA